MPCILVQNKIDLVNENDAKNDASLKDFALKNNFVKSFRTSVKKNIGVNETMDFFIGYIVDKINEMKKKKSEQKKNISESNINDSVKENVKSDFNEDNDEDENNKNQIILSSKNLENAKETLKKLEQTNCCANLNKLNLENKNTKEKISGNSNSTNINSEEEKKENE